MITLRSFIKGIGALCGLAPVGVPVVTGAMKAPAIPKISPDVERNYWEVTEWIFNRDWDNQPPGLVYGHGIDCLIQAEPEMVIAGGLGFRCDKASLDRVLFFVAHGIARGVASFRGRCLVTGSDAVVGRSDSLDVFVKVGKRVGKVQVFNPKYIGSLCEVDYKITLPPEYFA